LVVMLGASGCGVGSLFATKRSCSSASFGRAAGSRDKSCRQRSSRSAGTQGVIARGGSGSCERFACSTSKSLPE
jgi:hypothetical protein